MIKLKKLKKNLVGAKLNIMIKNILLNKKDFEKLTKGEVIEKDGIKIAIQDIGYQTMINILDENYYLNDRKKYF